MLKKAVLGFSIFFQLLLVGFLSFHIYFSKQKGEIIENLFVDTFADKENNTIPFSSYIEVKGITVPKGGYLTISAPKEGVVDNTFVEQGSYVKKGSPLFKMSDQTCYIEIKEKEEQLAMAKAFLAYKKIGTTKYALLAKEKELEEIALKKEQGEKDAAIFKELLEQMAVSVSETDEKLLFAKITEKEYEKAQAELKALQAPMCKQEEAIYLHQIEEKKAALKQAFLTLEKTLVTAPISGTVVDVLINKGAYLSENNSVGVILAGDEWMVKVIVPEENIHKINKGKGLKAIAAINTQHYCLKYHSHNPKLSIYANGSNKLELYFTFEKEPTSLYLGESLKVYIETFDIMSFCPSFPFINS